MLCVSCANVQNVCKKTPFLVVGEVGLLGTNLFLGGDGPPLRKKFAHRVRNEPQPHNEKGVFLSIGVF